MTRRRETGQYMDDDNMQEYVEFMCGAIALKAGATVNSTTGFPMKGCYVPVNLEIVSKMRTSAAIRMTALGYEAEFVQYMSRHKSPDKILHELQQKINEITLQIINDNNLDQEKIYKEHHPFKNID